MKVAIILDDPSRIDFILEDLLQNYSDHSTECGIYEYFGEYKNKQVTIFYFASKEDALSLHVEDLFVKRRFDFIINIGECFSTDLSKVDRDTLLFVSEAIRDDKSIKLDSHLLTIMNDINSKQSPDNQIFPLSCYSLTECINNQKLQQQIPGCYCIDKKSFFLYEIANRYNKRFICFYYARDPDMLDLHQYLMEKNIANFDILIRFALELLMRIF